MHVKSVSVRSDSFPVRDAYPFSLEILQGAPRLEFGSPIACFSGENGTGKSTLLAAMARACGIHIWRSETLGRRDLNLHEERLNEHLEVEWAGGRVSGSYFGSDLFRDFSRILEGWAESDPGQLEAFGGRSLLTLSHGQAMMSYFRARYAIPGVYFLDEPETALSPRSQLELIGIVREAAGSGRAQFLIATHSPFMLAIPGAEIWSFGGAAPIRIAYEESAPFKLYRGFLADPAAYLG